MRNFPKLSLTLLILLLASFVGACSRSSSGPPPPLAADQIPGALQKAFSKSDSETKGAVEAINTALGAQEYSKVYGNLQTLIGKPGLNKEQQDIASRAMLTVNGLLQTAQSKGDEQAAQTLQTYRRKK